MGKNVLIFFATLIVYICVDLTWLGVITVDFYKDELGGLLLPEPNLLPAAIFYVLYVIGLMVFVILPGLASKSFPRTTAHAALFGLVAYSTYDLSNLATLHDWPVHVVIADIGWGVVVSMITVSAGYFSGVYLKRT